MVYKKTKKSYKWSVSEIIKDYKLSIISRQCSIVGRRLVLSGKAKFGIFGDGKELPQIAMAKAFKNGDFRSGYYRDQTFMMAINALSIKQFFAQLYAHSNIECEPNAGGRQMCCHYATHLLDEKGNWLQHTAKKNSSSDVSPTGGQMARLVGLAHASKYYRLHPDVEQRFSINGNEVAFGTIGDASTSEGVFWEAINAAGVLQVPMVLSVWDDGYGISVPKNLQTTKSSISKLLRGFQRTKNELGMEIVNVKGWQYDKLCQTYAHYVELARKHHIPIVIHVDELTQPLGHSTSGSHERYKTKERLLWEKNYCCINRFEQWIIEQKLLSKEQLKEYKTDAIHEVTIGRKQAWKEYIDDFDHFRNELISVLQTYTREDSSIQTDIDVLKNDETILFKELAKVTHTIYLKRHFNNQNTDSLVKWKNDFESNMQNRYNSHLHSQTPQSAINIKVCEPTYHTKINKIDGRIILRDNFDFIFKNYANVMAIGEDIGKLGGVNQGYEGLQKKYGIERVIDAGIREATILGQGIGMAMRGLRPIIDIQYLDYLLYCFQILSDDLATVSYRSKGKQRSPVIIRTRGHRLEGVWHAGSPMGMIINGIRGVYLCVPRNMTEAAGFYNTLMQSDSPGLVIEPLNAYRIKENMPSNVGHFTTPLGVPYCIQEGKHITVVSYGSTLNIIIKLLPQLEKLDIHIDLWDIRTLLPFDRFGVIAKSLQKTNHLLIIDEDITGGATGYMLQQILEKHNGYYYLDSAPRTLSAHEHRPAHGSDGDYFSKPNTENIFDVIYDMMSEIYPKKYRPYQK